MRNRSLQAQLNAIFLGFLLLVISSVVATFWLAQTQQQDATIINLAGRQRMLAQQMARLALTDPENQELTATMTRFTYILAALQAGGQVVDGNGRVLTLPPTTNPTINRHLDEVAATWHTFQEQLQNPVNTLTLPAQLATFLIQLDTLTSAYATQAESKITRLRLMQILFLATACLLLAWGYRFTQYRLIQPLNTLGLASQAIGSGHLYHPIPPLQDDELGQLAQTMETMQAELSVAQNLLEQRVTQRTQELVAAFEFSQEIVRQLQPEQLLQSVTDRARELMQGQTASICLLEEGAAGDNLAGYTLKLVANSGDGPNYLGLRQPVARGLALPVIQEQQTVVTAGGCAHCAFLDHFPHTACIAAPLQIGSKPLGAICVVRLQRHFDAAEARALTLLANAAAIALENSRLIAARQRQTEENASLAERERLSADLHDNLAQTLGAMHLGMDQLAHDITTGEVAQARFRVMALQQQMKRAYAQLRMSLTGLRETAPAEDEFLDNVQAVLADFEAQSGLPVCLSVVGEAEGSVTAVIQKQALHILREALTNIHRHAQASQVQIAIARENNTLTLQITDNGIGFDSTQINSQYHLGLNIMYTRAERSQGKLTILTAPGQGTKLTATLPINFIASRPMSPSHSEVI